MKNIWSVLWQRWQRPRGRAAAQSMPHVCIDRALPTAVAAPLLCGALDSTANDFSAESTARGRGALARTKMWTPVGRQLRVRFLNGHPTVQQKVMQFAPIWSQHANLHFHFGEDPAAEIRISFDQPGSWSYIGTDALQIPATEPTMNFGWLTPGTPNDEVMRVVLHEFGHAIGLIHEHQNPAALIPWNRAAVYEYYGGPPNYWNRAAVDRNLFQRYAVDNTQYSTFDPASIMLYPIPPEFAQAGFSVGWNQVLSPLDQSFIASCYPYSQA